MSENWTREHMVAVYGEAGADAMRKLSDAYAELERVETERDEQAKLVEMLAADITRVSAERDRYKAALEAKNRPSPSGGNTAHETAETCDARVVRYDDYERCGRPGNPCERHRVTPKDWKAEIAREALAQTGKAAGAGVDALNRESDTGSDTDAERGGVIGGEQDG